jgi:Transposase, Mutator family
MLLPPTTRGTDDRGVTATPGSRGEGRRWRLPAHRARLHGVPGHLRTKLHLVNTLERLNKEVKRRANVVGIFPSEASIVRLIGAVPLEANDEWQLKHRYMGVEALAELLDPNSTNDALQLPPMAA